MKIAFVSYEYPPKTAVGGIGTYIYQAAQLLKNRGNYIEVFSTTEENTSESIIEDGLLIHRIDTDNKIGFPEKLIEFRQRLIEKFTERQNLIKFDIIEGAEYGANSIELRKYFPEIPLHIKLHTPNFLVTQLNNFPLAFIAKLRFIGGSFKKFKKPKIWADYIYLEDKEYQITKQADLISSPSKDLKRIIISKWNIPAEKIKLLPYPFTPSPSLLSIVPGINNYRDTHIITFIGKLERRKGVLNFLNVIPAVLKKKQNVIFRFLGRSISSPNPNLNMQEYLSDKLKNYLTNIEFKGEITYTDLPKYLSETTLCVFPSLWENFPNVCLEAMAAGRCIIGSNQGGMAEMLNHDCGILINPNNHKEITKEILKILDSPKGIYDFGVKARDKVLNSYNSNVIGKLYEDAFTDMLKNYKSPSLQTQ